ncbi:MAG TPA: AraC family transcriptional regulator [Ferruginibacter sp.]|nr:AraC family transcriptional regulator [Ferruginibacter sp.]HPH91096.1 AraC family transcriptional regulator [Ferruginibacter sp.]
MIVLELSHTDNKSLLQMLAATTGMPYHGEDFITLHPPAGEGVIKVINLAEELQVLLADVVFNSYFLAKRKPSDKRYYVLHFDDVLINDTATFTVDGEKLEKKQTRHSVARLTSNVFSNAEEVSAYSHIKSVKVFFSEAWLKKYLGLDDTVDGLQKYISLKTACFDGEPLDAEYLSLMDELWNAKKEDPLQNIFLQNRITLLIERFFTRLAEKMKKWDGGHNIPQEDMERFMQVEHLLVKDLSEKPPTIDQLSKLVTMSATRLKKGFKEMYGTGIYTYYQKARLQKAKEMLLSGTHSMKDIAAATGFYNTANFATAFKKEFNLLPSQMVNRA